MKRILPVLLVAFISLSVCAQKKSHKKDDAEKKEFIVDSTSVLTLDKTIKALYKVISAEKEQERNWKQFKFLFHPDAKLIATGMNQDYEYKAKYLTPSDYIKNSGKWLKLNGFIEKEIKP